MNANPNTKAIKSQRTLAALFCGALSWSALAGCSMGADKAPEVVGRGVLTITTGDDDLRADSGAGAWLRFVDGTTQKIDLSRGGKPFTGRSTVTIPFDLMDTAPIADVEIALASHDNDLFETNDHWNIASVMLSAANTKSGVTICFADDAGGWVTDDAPLVANANGARDCSSGTN